MNLTLAQLAPIVFSVAVGAVMIRLGTTWNVLAIRRPARCAACGVERRACRCAA